MKKTWKAILVTLICVLLFGMTAAAASPTVAMIGKKKYTSLEAAYAKVKKGQTITLKRDITVSDGLVFHRNVKFTLDLGKRTITCKNTDTADIFVNKGNVTFKNGTIKGVVAVKKNATLNISSGTYGQIMNLGTVTIKNAKLTRQDQAPLYNIGGKMTIQKATVKSARGCIYISGGTVNISGGTYNNTDVKNEMPLITLEKGTLTVSGGKFTSKDCVLFNYNGKATLKKGTFTSKAFCTIINSKSLVISGATVNYTGTEYCGVYCQNGSSTQIKKGTVKGKKMAVLVERGYKSFKLSGGKVTNSQKDMPPVCVNEKKSSKASIKQKYISTPCALKVFYME